MITVTRIVLTAVGGNSSIHKIPSSHRVDSEVEIIDTSVRWDGAVEHEFITG